jgi:hypothetical protein
MKGARREAKQKSEGKEEGPDDWLLMDYRGLVVRVERSNGKSRNSSGVFALLKSFLKPCLLLSLNPLSFYTLSPPSFLTEPLFSYSNVGATWLTPNKPNASFSIASLLLLAIRAKFRPKM